MVDICVHMNNVSKDMAARYLQEMRRHYYISPTSYLHFIGTFARLLVEKRAQLAQKKERYAMGIKKLLETADSVAQMRTTLEALQPQLITASLETEHMLAEVQRQKTEADLARDIIKGEEVVAGIDI